MELEELRWYSDGLQARWPGFYSQQGQDISYSTVLRSALEPPSLLSNGYWRLLSWAYIGQGVKLTTHLHLMSRSRMVVLYFHSLINLHDMMLN
jgi:hypothetical protein